VSPSRKKPALLPVGRAEVRREGREVQIWALGPLLAEAETLASRLAEVSGASVGVVNARFAKPLDRELLVAQAPEARLFVTLEDHVRTGGFGSALLETLADEGWSRPVERIGWPDHYIDHGDSDKTLRAAVGLDPETLFASLRARLEELFGDRLEVTDPAEGDYPVHR